MEGVFSYGALFDGSHNWTFSHYFDDQFNFVESPRLNSLRPLTIEHLSEVIGHVGINVFEPVYNLFKALECDLVGADPRNLRVVTLGLHTLNALLLAVWLYLLIGPRRQQRQSWMCICIASFFWWVHPLNVEAIGWLSAQGYALALAQILLSSIALEIALAYPEVKSVSFGALAFSVLFYVSSCLTKAPSVVLSAVHIARIALDKPPPLRVNRFHLRLYFPAVLAIACAVLVRVIVSANIDNVTQHNLPRSAPAIAHALIKAAYTVQGFIQRVVWPFDLRAHYRVPRVFAVAAYNPAPDPLALLAHRDVAASVCILALETLLVLLYPGTVLGWLAFGGFWLPCCGLFPHGWAALGADRYCYIPSALLSASVVSLLLQVFSDDRPVSPRGWRLTFHRSAIALLMAVYCLVLGFESHALLLTWRSDKYFLQRCVDLDPLDVDCRMYLAEFYGKHENNDALGTFHREEGLRVMSLLDVKDWLFKARTLLLMRRQSESCAAISAAFEASDREGYWAWSRPSSVVGPFVPPDHLGMLLNNLLICEALDHFADNSSSTSTKLQEQASERRTLVGQVLQLKVASEVLVDNLTKHFQRLERLALDLGPPEPFAASFFW